jgi:hypothetical protein
MKFFFPILFLAFTVSSCDRDGCTDLYATNYESKADNDDGSCQYDSDAFAGRWEARDSILTFATYIAEPVKTIDIRVQVVNKSKVRFFWRYEDGTYSDTLDGNTKPNALTIPEQTFQDTLIISGSFTVAGIGKIKSSYTLSNTNVFLQKRGVATMIN